MINLTKRAETLNDSPRHEFEWKREECFMVRKPDPPVLVAITKEPAGRIKTTSIQILDYNLNRYFRSCFDPRRSKR